MSAPYLPEPGHVLYLDQDASVQFHEPLLFRVAVVEPPTMFDGWAWLTGDQLDYEGGVIDRRKVYVRLAGVNRIKPPPRWPAPDATTPRSTP